MKREQAEIKLSPKEYRELLNAIDLEDIAMESCTAKKAPKWIDSPDLNIAIKFDGFNKTIEDVEGKFFVSVKYSFLAYKRVKKDWRVKIDALYNLEFNVEREIPKGFWEIYTEKSIHINTWPYFRELVQSFLQKMGLPSLTLPLFKI